MRSRAWAVAGAVMLGAWLTGCPGAPRPPGTTSTAASEPAASAPDATPGAPGSASAVGSAWATVGASMRPAEAEVMAALGASSVLSSNPVRRVLYTWTSEEQGQRLRADRVLLVKGSNDGPGMSRFDTSLWASYATDPWARVLLNPPFHRVRYAWPTPWATRLSPDDKSYGDVLVRVELKPEAIVAGYVPFLPPENRWVFHGPDGRHLSSTEALAAAGRIGAVYHVNSTSQGGVGLREYLICNEAMVASWSLATDEVKAEIESGQHTIDLLTRFTQGRSGWGERLALESFLGWQLETMQTWLEPGDPASVDAAYAASLAFTSPDYQPAEGTLLSLADAMHVAATKLASQGPALVHRPSAPLPGRVTVPAPVPPRPRRPCTPRGTFGCYEPENLPCRNGEGRIVPCTL